MFPMVHAQGAQQRSESTQTRLTRIKKSNAYHFTQIQDRNADARQKEISAIIGHRLYTHLHPSYTPSSIGQSILCMKASCNRTHNQTHNSVQYRLCHCNLKCSCKPGKCFIILLLFYLRLQSTK